jgi:glutamine synthetase
MGKFMLPDSAKESPAALLKWAKENEIQELDFRFVDIRGIAQHFSMPLGNGR